MIPPSKTVIPDPDTSIPHDGDKPMSGDQADLLRALCDEASEPFDGNLTQAQAEERISALREKIDTK